MSSKDAGGQRAQRLHTDGTLLSVRIAWPGASKADEEPTQEKESYLQRVRVPNIDRVVKGPRDKEAGVDWVPRNGRDGELVGARRSPEGEKDIHK